jgi:peptidoglycan/xylan/chitin deacetylase (PgdA/CDA1 family)
LVSLARTPVQLTEPMREAIASPSRGDRLLAALAFLLVATALLGQTPRPASVWPDGRQAAVSLTFDDARSSQLDVALPLLDQYGVKATFFVLTDMGQAPVAAHLDAWRRVVAQGHEIGNHSMSHPCSGNAFWSRDNAIETYDLDRIRDELERANARIAELLGVTPETLAYPCGHTFVGRGTATASYVPVVARMFLAGRGWRSEWANDPTVCDLAQVAGIGMDQKALADVLPLLAEAGRRGQWLVLVGHTVGTGGPETTRVDMPAGLIEYAQNPANGIWLAPFGCVARFLAGQRAATR